MQCYPRCLEPRPHPALGPLGALTESASGNGSRVMTCCSSMRGVVPPEPQLWTQVLNGRAHCCLEPSTAVIIPPPPPPPPVVGQHVTASDTGSTRKAVSTSRAAFCTLALECRSRCRPRAARRTSRRRRHRARQVRRPRAPARRRRRRRHQRRLPPAPKVRHQRWPRRVSCAARPTGALAEPPKLHGACGLSTCRLAYALDCLKDLFPVQLRTVTHAVSGSDLVM